MAFEIRKGIDWVGKVDWEIRKFHGEEYSTHRGSTYNAYLVRDEKTALVETVWGPFAEEFLEQLRGVIDLADIDYVIANHAEPDHSGGLPALMKALGDKPIYCTKNAVKSLTGHYHQDWDFQVVKTGDRLSLGARELIFVEAPMLHWPDTMMCYLTGDAVLFSNDAFGQHLASEHMYNDLVDQNELFDEAIKYYANILTPFSPLVKKKIQEFLSLNLPLEMICPSHGVIWRKDPAQIVTQYLEWADDYQENQAVVIYDTMWNSTRVMAESIAQGLYAGDPSLTVKVINCARGDLNDAITEVFKSKLVLVGSPTFNQGVLSDVAAILEEMRGLKFKAKKAAAFGSYGWSGESVKVINQRLSEAGFELVNDGLRLLWRPDEDAREQCREFGGQLALSL